MMEDRNLSRRDFLLRASALGAAAVGGGSLLAACGGGETAQQPAEETTAPMGEEAPSVAGGCNDLSGLTDQEKQMRTALKYVDETPEPDKRCDNCQLYTAPEGDAPCGGCQILKGPIAPGGYCTSWAAKQV